jgi:hypothetical protein
MTKIPDNGQYESMQIFIDGELTWEVDTLINLVNGKESISVSVDSLPEFSPKSWINHPARFSSITVGWIMEHSQRILDADLYYPIILTPDGKIADGIHRLAKARWLGLSHINAVVLPNNYLNFAVGKI